MPLRHTSGDPPFSRAGGGELATWQTAALSLGAVSYGVIGGFGTVLGAVAIVCVVYVFSRLQQHAPDARSTAELIGSTLGPRLATTAGLIQLIAYLTLAATVAAFAGIQINTVAAHDESAPWNGIAAAAAIAVVIIPAVLIAALPTRWAAAVVALIAGIAVLITLYLGLAVTAKVLIEPPLMNPSVPPPAPPSIAMLVVSAIGLVGLEICTTQNRSLRSAAWSMGLPAAMVGVTGLLAGLASQLAVQSSNSSVFTTLVSELYGATGELLLVVAALSCLAATQLAFLWGAANVGSDACQRLFNRRPARAITTGIIAVLAGGLASVLGSGRLGEPANFGLIAATLIFMLYVAAAQSNSRIPGAGAVDWWIGVVVIAVVVGAFLILLSDHQYMRAALSSVFVAFVITAVSGIAALLTSRSG